MGTPGNVDDPFSRLGPAEHVELTNLRSDLRRIVFRRACELNFGDVYSRVYFLVTRHDHGAAVYGLCVMVFMYMARRMSRKRYDLGVHLITSLCMYLDQVWARANGYPPLQTQGAAMYDMPRIVAQRRWRKAIRLVVRKQRIENWLVVFNQYAFKPKGVSAARVAAHYAEFVAQHEA